MATVNISTHTFEAGASILHPRNLHSLNYTKLLNLAVKSPSSSSALQSKFPFADKIVLLPIHCSCSSDTASPLSRWTNLLRYKRSRRRRGIVVGAVVVVGVEREWEGRRRS
ncbi:hypothetical protein ACFX12_010182 [Malus domestica]